MIVLDTHTFIRMILTPSSLPSVVLDAIQREGQLGVPAISLWEIAMLCRKSRLELPDEPLLWFQRALALPKMALLPLTPEIAALSETLRMHGDPADRMIVATAITHDCALATADGKITEAGLVPVIW